MWKPLRSLRESYNYLKLIDARTFEDLSETAEVQIICDIDKTYLEVEFDSWFKIARIALEGPRDKITVQGASEVLMALRWSSMKTPSGLGAYPRPLHFVTSSPSQIRDSVEEKLALDGLDWTTATFKNQAYNIMKGRMDLLRHHVAYKTAAILAILHQSPQESRFFLIGDNAEADAYIYVGLQLFTSGKLGADGFQAYLQAAGVEASLAKSLAATERPKSKCAGILIREVKQGFSLVPPLTDGIILFKDYLCAAMALYRLQVLDGGSLRALARRFHNRFAMPLARVAAICACAESLARDDLELGDLRTLFAQAPKSPDDGDVKKTWESAKRAKDIGFTPAAELSEDRIVAIAEGWAKEFQRKKGAGK